MEKKQLDFNAPLLSVRRISSVLASSNRDTRAIHENALPNRWHNLLSVKSDFNLDQVTEPVAVPFLWEHSPGRAKSKSGPQLQPRPQPLEDSSVSPRLPPGKVWDIIPLPANKELEDHNVLRTQTQASFLNCNLTKFESSNECVNEKGRSDRENDDDAYSDALDTLSPASFSHNCSVSGLSGSDGFDGKPSGTFSTDPQTRDFMLSRFLPAAKAMTLEPTHYVSRKQSLTLSHEQPREIKKMVSEDRKLLLKEYESRTTPYFDQAKGEEESESEDDDYDNYENSAIASAKSCGLFPRLKNSLCLLNPVPGMNHSTQSPRASTSEVRRQKKAYSGPLSQNIDKHALDAMYKHKFDYGAKNKQTGKSNHVMYSGELQTTNRSSPYRNSRSGGISPYRNEAPVSPLHQAIGFLGVPKEAGKFKANRSNVYNRSRDKFKKVLSDQKNEQRPVSVSPTVEKTLYIDSVNVVEYSNSRSNSSDTKGQMDSASKDFDILAESRAMETTAESSFHDINSLNVLKGSSILKAKVSGFRNADPPFHSDISHGQEKKTVAFRTDQGLHQESRSLECLNVNSDQNIKANAARRNSHVSSLQSTLTPPLPKSPSESWLWRALPSVPSRNPSPHSRRRKLAPTTSSTGTKWENIVKTSYLHHDHVRYSEELVANVRKQSRT